MSSTRPRMSSTARGIATRDAMPSAYVAALSVSIGSAGPPRQGHRRGGLGLDADDPAAGRRVPEPRSDAVEERAVADRHAGDDRHRQRAGRRRVRDLERERRGARRDPRVVAVDQERAHARSAAYASDAPRASSKSSPCSITVAPSARMRATFARLARVEQNTTAGTPSARAAYATPWPKLPADTHTTARSGRHGPLPCQRRHRDPRPAALERADRVDRLDLDDDRDTKARGQALVDVLRGVGEDRVDATGSGADGRRLQVRDSGSRRGLRRT